MKRFFLISLLLFIIFILLCFTVLCSIGCCGLVLYRNIINLLNRQSSRECGREMKKFIFSTNNFGCFVYNVRFDEWLKNLIKLLTSFYFVSFSFFYFLLVLFSFELNKFRMSWVDIFKINGFVFVLFCLDRVFRVLCFFSFELSVVLVS